MSDPAATPSFERSLVMMLQRALNAVLPEFRPIIGRFGLTGTQWRVMRVLWEGDGRSVLELARATLVSAPSLVGVVDRLARDGLVERRPCDVDRRRVYVHLTRRGRALEQRVSPLLDEVYARIEGRLSQTEWRSLYSALERLSDVAPAGAESQRSEDTGRVSRHRSAAAGAWKELA